MVQSILRGCYSYSIIQLTVNQSCHSLIDAALYRGNPDGQYEQNNYIHMISDKACEHIMSVYSGVKPKRVVVRTLILLGAILTLL